jgi:hypothetical protein
MIDTQGNHMFNSATFIHGSVNIADIAWACKSLFLQLKLPYCMQMDKAFCGTAIKQHHSINSFILGSKSERNLNGLIPAHINRTCIYCPNESCGAQVS